MNNFRKDFIAKKGSCFKMEERSPLGKVEGDDKKDPVEDPNKISTTVKYKRGKAKGNTKYEFETEYDGEGYNDENIVGHDYKAYDRKGNLKPNKTNSGGTLETEEDKKNREESES